MPTARNNVRAGMDGQLAAEEFLRRAGFFIVARNYRLHTGEIDLIAREGTYLIFIEVKTRHSTKHGHGREAVTPQKQQRIIKTALHYIATQIQRECDTRFDVIEVTYIAGRPDIVHIRDAFWA